MTDKDNGTLTLEQTMALLNGEDIETITVKDAVTEQPGVLSQNEIDNMLHEENAPSASNDKMHGKGKYTYKNGDVYEGDFAKGNPHGKGKMTWADGRVYTGDFAKGKRNGNGKMTYLNGKVEDGKWKDSEFVG
jgi:hypothetical protein